MLCSFGFLKWIGELFASNVALYITKLFLADSTSSTGSSNSFYTSGKPRLCSSSAVNGSNQLCSYLADRLAADKIDLAAPPFSSKVSANKPHLTQHLLDPGCRRSRKRLFLTFKGCEDSVVGDLLVTPYLQVPPHKYPEKGADWLNQGVNPIIKKRITRKFHQFFSSY